MSSLSSDCNVCYMAYLYNEYGGLIDKSGDCYDLEEAIETGKEMVRDYVETHYEWCHVEVKCIVQPTYK